MRKEYKKNKLGCPLAVGEVEVRMEVIDYLEEHRNIDVYREGRYLFTLERMEGESTRTALKVAKAII